MGTGLIIDLELWRVVSSGLYVLRKPHTTHSYGQGINRTGSEIVWRGRIKVQADEDDNDDDDEEEAKEEEEEKQKKKKEEMKFHCREIVWLLSSLTVTLFLTCLRSCYCLLLLSLLSPAITTRLLACASF